MFSWWGALYVLPLADADAVAVEAVCHDSSHSEKVEGWVEAADREVTLDESAVLAVYLTSLTRARKVVMHLVLYWVIPAGRGHVLA